MVKELFREKLGLLRFFVVSVLVLFFTFSFANKVSASPSSGTIDVGYEYAWGENIGWINFRCDECGVGVTDVDITGYAWSEQYGWINLNPTTSGIVNNGEGTLSGYAWGENIGWINFSGVTINSSGEFVGYATIDSNSSRINFNCVTGNSCASSNFKVRTDWRPISVRGGGGGSGGGGGGGSGFPVPPVTPPDTTPPSDVTPPTTPPPTIIDTVIDTIIDFFTPPIPPAIVEVPKIAPLAFNPFWNLLPVKAINSFVFAPLPYEVRILAAKFPELSVTLKNVGIDRLSDLSKLSGVTFNIPGLVQLEETLKNIGVERLSGIDNLSGVTLKIPGLSAIDQKLITSLGTGKISLISGLPVAQFPSIAKRSLPTEFVFARTAGELVDLNVAISVGERGQVAQTISSLPGKTLRLVVKPISRARSVEGFFIFKSATPKVSTLNSIARASLTASALFSTSDLVETNPEPINVENKLVLSTFEYTDPDGDGIYTADVLTPAVPGEYEVITVIDYVDPTLGVRQMRMITVIDPEGYVFEKNNGKETRIPSAIVSLYELNVATKKYELWDAKAYQQENPQITDVRGTYSFLVPEGTYYFYVEAPGYDNYQSKAFTVSEGAGVHQNIELNSSGFTADVDWKTILLVVVFLLLVYNLYRNRERDKLLKSLSKK